jgi:transcriptional regulator with XRE-family HTH domain
MNKRIISIRKSNDLTQEEFAYELGISINQLLKIEQDQLIPSENLISKLCYNFKVDRNWLLYGKETDFIFDNTIACIKENIIAAIINIDDNIFHQLLVTLFSYKSTNSSDETRMASYLNELEAEKKVIIFQALLSINVITNDNSIHT